MSEPLLPWLLWGAVVFLGGLLVWLLKRWFIGHNKKHDAQDEFNATVLVALDRRPERDTVMSDVRHELSSHSAVCQERFARLRADIDRIEKEPES